MYVCCRLRLTSSYDGAFFKPVSQVTVSLKEESSDDSTIISSKTSTLTRNQVQCYLLCMAFSHCRTRTQWLHCSVQKLPPLYGLGFQFRSRSRSPIVTVKCLHCWNGYLHLDREPSPCVCPAMQVSQYGLCYRQLYLQK